MDPVLSTPHWQVRKLHARHSLVPVLARNILVNVTSLALSGLGITGILMSAAALPVCLTRPPKLVLHPPPVSKSDIKPVPGLGHCCRKTTKKQARKGARSIQDQPEQINEITNTSVRFFFLSLFSSSPFCLQAKHQRRW